jgi:predicted nucleic acid-binding protein
MIYFDVSYIIRLYFEDNGWERVRALAATAPVACSLHGYSEVIAALHRKYREKVLTPGQYRQTLEQFALDCDEDAYMWLPVSAAVSSRLKKSFETLPRTVFLRASDALHLACAAENHFREIYSNDRILLAAASHFALRGIDVSI